MNRSLSASLVLVLLAPFTFAANSTTKAAATGDPTDARAENDGLGRTPILGWSSWSFIRKHPTAAKIEAQARAMRKSGLEKIGYRYINLDDFWYQCPGSQGPNVDHYGRWVTDSSKFPAHGANNGIKVAADYIHSLGEKFGIYVTPGISKQAVAKSTPIKGTRYTADQIAEPSVSNANYNCKGMVGINYDRPGAQAYINSWADMLASWNVDYVKLDGIANSNTPDIKAWSAAIRQSGRPMILDVTQGSYTQTIASVLMKYADQWEFAPDIECYRCEKNGSPYPLTSWAHVKNRFDYVAEWQPYAGPGGFNDYDSIEVGNGSADGLTAVERQTQMSLWALGSSPFILGVDLTHLNKMDLQYLKNTQVLAVDQDSIAARRVVDTGTRQVFTKKETNGDVIVGLFNNDSEAQTISVQPSTVGLPTNQGGYLLTNLWTRKVTKTSGNISASVPSHGVALYRVRILR